ncbi:HAD family hydrolase [Micromonospora schwarzwaldensis]
MPQRDAFEEPEFPGGRYTLVATDLDGTLLRSDLTISARTRCALATIPEGAVHIVVTGRPASGCLAFLAAIGYRGVAVCGQGGQLYDADSHRLLWSTGVDLDVARRAVGLLAAELPGLLVAVGTAGLHGGVLSAPGFSKRGEKSHQLTTDSERLWAAPIEKVMIRHPGVDDETLAAGAREACGSDLTVTHGDAGTIELLPPGVTKGSGLARAADYLGLTASRAVAFGDMPNDIPMFAWAGHSVAVANAHASVLAAAGEICASNDEDGVAQVIERLYRR